MPVAIAVAFGCGLLAMAGFSAFAGEDAPAREPTAVTSGPTEAERVAAELAELRDRNASARAELDAASSDVDRVLEERRLEAADDPSAKDPARPRPKKRPRPHKPTETSSNASTHRPIPIDNDRDPLASIR